MVCELMMKPFMPSSLIARSISFTARFGSCGAKLASAAKRVGCWSSRRRARRWRCAPARLAVSASNICTPGAVSDSRCMSTPLASMSARRPAPMSSSSRRYGGCSSGRRVVDAADEGQVQARAQRPRGLAQLRGDFRHRAGLLGRNLAQLAAGGRGLRVPFHVVSLALMSRPGQSSAARVNGRWRPSWPVDAVPRARRCCRAFRRARAPRRHRA